MNKLALLVFVLFSASLVCGQTLEWKKAEYNPNWINILNLAKDISISTIRVAQGVTITKESIEFYDFEMYGLASYRFYFRVQPYNGIFEKYYVSMYKLPYGSSIQFLAMDRVYN